MRRHIKGISLVECLLSLAVIASISAIAVRYYLVTTRDMHVSQAIHQIKRVTDASYQWLQAQQQANFSDEGGGKTISIEALIEAGLLQKDTDTLDPWGDQVTVSPSDSHTHVRITLDQLPKLDCKNITQQLKYINHSQNDNHCDDEKSNSFVGEF